MHKAGRKEKKELQTGAIAAVVTARTGHTVELTDDDGGAALAAHANLVVDVRVAGHNGRGTSAAVVGHVTENPALKRFNAARRGDVFNDVASFTQRELAGIVTVSQVNGSTVAVARLYGEHTIADSVAVAVGADEFAGSANRIAATTATAATIATAAAAVCAKYAVVSAASTAVRAEIIVSAATLAAAVARGILSAEKSVVVSTAACVSSVGNIHSHG